jgi:hypothetical protein
VADWDNPEDVWTSDYFYKILQTVAPKLAVGAALVVFGDSFSVLPELHQAIKKFNQNIDSTGFSPFVSPVQFFFHKTNKTHKGVGAYCQSNENAYLYYYKTAPKVQKFADDSGTFVSGPTIAGRRQIVGPSSKVVNPCQKPHNWLSLFIENHATPKSLVLDLTAGSGSSFLACFTSQKTLNWAGCDVDPAFLDNFFHLRELLTTNSEWLTNFIEGRSIFSLSVLNY